MQTTPPKHRNAISQDKFQIEFADFLDEVEILKNFINSESDILIGEVLNEDNSLVYFFVDSAWDDFMEIVLLCANGYPLGGRKILRSLFEKTVHILYFQEHPEKIESFRNYAWIDEQKIVNLAPERFDKEYIDEVNEIAEKYKRDFVIRNCNCRRNGCIACTKTRPAISWFGDKSLIKVAYELEIPKKVLVDAYYLPLQETHPKLQSILMRTDLTNGKYTYTHDYSTELNQSILDTAHWLFINTIKAFLLHFDIEDTTLKLEKLEKDYLEIWNNFKV